MKNTFSKSIALLGAVLGLSSLASSARADFSFHVDIDTASLVNAANGPYSLDFTLIQGSIPTNTVTISDFSFTGGTPTGTPTITNGGAGTLGHTVTLTDAAFYNDIYQNFTAGTTDISFNVSTTQNLGSTPDGFSVSILDNTILPIETTDPLGTDTLINLSVESKNKLSDVPVYSSTNPAGVTLTVSAVPEPSSWALMLMGLGLMATLNRRLRSV